MSHNVQSHDVIAMREGRKPWHGLNYINLPASATPEAWGRAVGFDQWRIELAPVRLFPDGTKVYNNKAGEPFWIAAKDAPLVDNVRIIRRIGPGSFTANFGVATDQYHPVQPTAQLAFLSSIASAGDATMATLGSVLNGRKVWAQLDLGESWEINGKRVEGYLSVLNTNDGTGAVHIKTTLTEVVCNNTFTFAARDRGGQMQLKFSHRTKITPEFFKQISKQAGLARENVRAFQEVARELADAYMPKQQVVDFVAKLTDSPAFLTKGGNAVRSDAAQLLDAVIAADEIEKDLEGAHADPDKLNRVGARILEHMLAGTPGTRPLNGGLSKMDAFDHVTYYGSNDPRIARTPGAAVDSSLGGRADTLKSKALTMLRAN